MTRSWCGASPMTTPASPTRLEELDPGGVTWCFAQAPVAGDQRDVEGLRKRDVRRVVGGQVVTQLPDPVAQLHVRIANKSEVAEVRACIRSAVVGQLAARRESAKGVKYFDVDEVRRVQVTVFP